MSTFFRSRFPTDKPTIIYLFSYTTRKKKNRKLLWRIWEITAISIRDFEADFLIAHFEALKWLKEHDNSN